MPHRNSKQDTDNTARSPTLTQPPPPSSSSYVYPVKSLLAGKIQPEVEQPSPLSLASTSVAPSRTPSIGGVNSGLITHLDHAQSSQIPPSSQGRGENQPNISSTLDLAVSNGFTLEENSGRHRSTSFSLPDKVTNDHSGRTDSKQKKRRSPHHTFRHFPAGDETTPRRFSTLQTFSTPSGDGSEYSSNSPLGIYMAEPQPMQNIPLPLLAATAAVLPAVSPPLPTVTHTQPPEGDYFSAMQSREASSGTTIWQDDSTNAHSEPEDSIPFNPSEYGLVHFPPLLPSTGSTNGSSSRADSESLFPGLHSGPGSVKGRGSQHGSDNRNTSLRQPSSSWEGDSSSRDAFHLFTPPHSNTSSNQDSSSRMSLDSEGPHIPFQFEHVEDAHGHHVVIGREGKLQQCEDEPIRTPGAVQGFGVLIAVDDLEDSLLVRQVSENSSEILGLPPNYLFSLECFTDALPDHQVDVLWDNIHFLTEPGTTSGDDDNSPQVFLLSGWGAPGSAIPGDPSSLDGRRTWTCWCAAHRTEGYSSPDSPNTGLIIIEFELEKDKLSPLYPPVVASGVSSPTSTSSSEPQGGLFTSTGKTSPVPGSDRTYTNYSDGTTPSFQSVVLQERDNDEVGGLEGDENWLPSSEDILESTTIFSKPIPALERLRHISRSTGSPKSSTSANRSNRRSRQRRAKERGSGVGMMEVFAVMAQINEQIGAAPDLDMFLKVVVGVIKDLTQFHRIMVYQFDKMWNGQVVSELVDWSQSHDLFKGLHFPAGDIPAQARALYTINKVRLLYDRGQPNARIVCRSVEDLSTPIDMTHCYLRAMSPIHTKYLENMGVRASMSISITAFDQLWGLVTCHSYGNHGMRVSFPVRQMLRLLSQSISRNIESLSYAQRLHTRKLVNTITSEQHPTGYIVSNANDLLGLFDADFGILVVGEGAKILGPNQHGQEILIMAEYLRLKQFDTIQASQTVIGDYSDLKLSTGLEVIAGLLYVPLSRDGRDFIAFLRRGQPRHVKWAGKPPKQGQGPKSLEPRTSFKIWSETVAGRCRAWTDEQLETAGVLALVYGKFIEVWRQKQSAMQGTKLANLILNNASHEVRTPLNHIINYLEMALNGSLDHETRENLSRSHAASKSLLFTINDLLDLTRLESGNETSFFEPFNLPKSIEESTYIYKQEAERRGLRFNLDLESSPIMVLGDSKKIRTAVQNLTANALQYTSSGNIAVQCTAFEEPEGLRNENQVVVEIEVADTGCGIEATKLGSIFREFEQVESGEAKTDSDAGVGLGLAVVARIVEQLGGQLRVESVVGKGSRFSFLIPLSLVNERAGSDYAMSRTSASSRSSGHSSLVGKSPLSSIRSRASPNQLEIEDLVKALSTNHLNSCNPEDGQQVQQIQAPEPAGSQPQSVAGIFPLTDPPIPIRLVKMDLEKKSVVLSRAGSPLRSPPADREKGLGFFASPSPQLELAPAPAPVPAPPPEPAKLRVLIVEDNDVNRVILGKRLSMNGHAVVNTTNGQEGLTMVERDQAFDVVFMDIQMPILNGFEAARCIRQLQATPSMFGRPSRKLNNGRIPIFAVSASLKEEQREELAEHGMDGWILKPIDFKRLNTILRGVLDPVQRAQDLYYPGCNWEMGGWLVRSEEEGEK